MPSFRRILIPTGPYFRPFRSHAHPEPHAMTYLRSLAAISAAVLLFLRTPGAVAQTTDRAAVASPAATPTADQAPDLVKQYQATITPEDLASHLYIFASDFFEGRDTGQRGQKLAATYLASQFRKMGVAPAGTANPSDPRSPEAYFQPVPLYSSKLVSANLTVRGADGKSVTSVFSAASEDDGFYVGFGAGNDNQGAVVFAGFGIADPEAGFDEMAALKASGIEIADKWLLMLGGEPMTADGKSVLTADGAASRWSRGPNAKFGGIMSVGMPAGVLYVVDHQSPRPMAELVKASKSQFTRPAGLSLDPPGAGGAGRGRRGFPPVLFISTETANALLSGSGHTVASLAASIASTRTPEVFLVEGAQAATSMETEAIEVSSENVVAFIEGSDPALRDQVVVISSHYDHVGVNPGLEGDQIFNGADDDGSGTVAVLEIAEAFARARDAGHGPRRSVVFLNVTGEEKGLLGSSYYTDRQPIFPLEKTVTNLNIDMIGRIDPTHPEEDTDYVYIIGSNLISQELHDINLRMNSMLGTDLDLHERFNSKDDPNRFYQRSDHWNFGKHSIPFIFFFTGTHDDYHGVDDEPEKIEYERMARIAQVIFATAWQVANQDTPPVVSGTGFN